MNVYPHYAYHYSTVTTQKQVLSNILLRPIIYSMKSLLKIAGMVKHTKARLVIAALLSILYAGINVVWPYFTKWIIDTAPSLVLNKPLSQVIPLVLIITAIMIAVGLLLAATETLNWWYSERTYHVVESELYKATFTKTQSLPISYFEENLSGSLQQKIYSGISSVTSWIIMTSQNLLEPSFVILFATVLIFINNPVVGVLTILSEILYVVDFLHSNKKSKPINEKANINTEQLNGKIAETFSHSTTIRTLSAEDSFKSKLFSLITKHRNIENDRSNLWGLSIGRRTVLMRTTFFISIGIMLFSLSQGKTTTGGILLIIIFLTQIQSQLMFFSRYLTATAENESRAKRLLDFLELKPEFEDQPNAEQISQIDTFAFDNVGFTYPKTERNAVKNINISLTQGRTIALVGPSGVGKSTITKLLLRFYEPSTGKITFNNIAAEEFTSDSIRRRIAVVMQDIALFNTTIIENLQIAKPGATEAEIQKAAKLAHAEEFITKLPKGYNTLVGERGVKLSGGQKQRIAIARAILKNPDIIILDEATSALDSESEKLVQDSLKKLLKNRSALIIAHRLSTVRHADEILVLQKGTVVERGTHEELMKNKTGLYKKLVDMQSATGKVEL